MGKKNNTEERLNRAFLSCLESLSTNINELRMKITVQICRNQSLLNKTTDAYQLQLHMLKWIRMAAVGAAAATATAIETKRTNLRW